MLRRKINEHAEYSFLTFVLQCRVGGIFMSRQFSFSSGISQLDRLLGGLLIGDNVVWYDHSGNLAYVFCLNFLKTSLSHGKEVIYISVDRSPKNLFERLWSLAQHPKLTVLDAFTCGKGAGSSIFLKFYQGHDPAQLCRIIKMERPGDMDYFNEILYGLQEDMQGDVRLIFESITGLQELWGGEEAIIKFYSHACPRLYELNTIAYWIAEKLAHSSKLKAQINQIAQVAIDLDIKRGTTALTILKAENRSTEESNKPHRYWTRGLNIDFDTDSQGPVHLNLGSRIKDLRIKRGLSQIELAKSVGVTASTISQIEANTIYPSLPALLKIAEVLLVSIGSLFQSVLKTRKKNIFPAAEGLRVDLRNTSPSSVQATLLTPVDFEGKMEPYIIEVEPGQGLDSHFFIHKGEEMGYLISGILEVSMDRKTYTISPGDTVYLTSELPSQWTNPGPDVAKLLWIKVV